MVGEIMLINVRSGVVDASLPEAVGFAVEAAQDVEDATGLAVGVWRAVYGRPLGSLAWSVQVDSFADLATMNQKLAENESFLAKSENARSLFMAGSFQDSLTRVVHSAGTPGAVGYVSGLTATGQAGKTAEVMAFGVDIADYVSSVTGNATMFCVDAFAAVGQVTWITAYAEAASIDEAQEQLMGDPGYLERTSAVADLFVAGTGQMALSQRIN